MKRIIAIALMLGILTPLCASAVERSAQISDVRAWRDGSRMHLAMNLLLPEGLKANSEVSIVPVICGADGKDSVFFEPVTLAGRSRFIQHQRRDQASTRARKGETVVYESSVEYQPWMELSNMSMAYREVKCCGEPVTEGSIPLASIDFRPVKISYTFENPPITVPANFDASPKIRNLQGEAYIDFPVNRTELYPDYRRNPAELAKINATIDSVKSDKDVTIRSISIKGYASPEGSYSNNIRLAKGRTATLADYVQKLHRFDSKLIHTAYEPEDWAGLRRRVLEMDLANKDGILAIIDSSLEPDAKNTKIQRTYPADYDFLLKNVYPALRHSDYIIEYEIRQFTDPQEIRKMLYTDPSKLSLNEIYLAAATIEPGTEEYTHLWDVASAMYPGEPTVQINATNAFLAAGELERAERILGSVSADNIEGQLARANLLALRGDLDGALAILNTLPADLAGATKTKVENLIRERSKAKGVTIHEDAATIAL